MNDIQKYPLLQLLILVAMCLITSLLMFGIGSWIAIAKYGASALSLPPDLPTTTANAYKIIQLFSAIGLFFIGPLLFLFLVHKNLASLKVTSKSPIFLPLAAILLLWLGSVPFLDWLAEWNRNIIFPEALSGIEEWMKTQENTANQITKLFLTMPDLTSFCSSLLIVAILPAIGEEILFRGVLQRIAIDWFKNRHVAIWTVAIIFSAIHLQFYGFFPRFAIGLFLGYLFHWSGSLILPIFVHLLNNGGVVFFAYFFPSISLEESLFADNPYQLFWTLGSIGVLAIGCYGINKYIFLKQ